MDKAVILAAGRGTRMRRSEEQAVLTPEQADLADRGLKALIPIKRPFLDYVLSRVAAAGYRRVCLVVGPHHDELRDYYGRVECRRVSIEFAVQYESLGTAHAVAAAAQFTAGDPFLVINSDNCYPASALRALRQADGGAVAGYDRRAMLRGSNIPPDRLAKFGLLEEDSQGYLKCVTEKPDPARLDRQPDPVLISMNCWRFGPEMLNACRAIEKSPRGEYEIPDAVMYSITRLGQRYQVLRCDEAVLDLSQRGDIAAVAKWLADEEVDL
jgi:glucose-1-phosphate thymidylyltransferase